jgi:predicted O-methyltransferase YrrM
MGEEGIVARLTVLMYLNNDFVGGETKFYQPLGETNGEFRLICAVRPMAGSILVFPQAVGEDAVEHARVHWPLHEGSPVQSGKRPKYVVRSDILFAKKKEQIQLDDPYTKHDHVVRNTFRQRSQAFNSGFLNHLASLYNPHMGVENLGPLLYSFIRFTKVKSVLEIGAGYTSLWIMQALKDNDDEMERICALGRSGKCLLLDIPWADPTTVEGYHNQKSSLLFVDNCRHQKETATGAAAVAKALGLETYMKFLVADAFELELEPHSVDLLWCDFGVGSRMATFALIAWESIRPGGFLVCHSTLTNQGTRDWLEAIRARQAESITGIPPHDYVELSLLEPHKRYQNAVTILQKRKCYEEPVHSLYA